MLWVSVPDAGNPALGARLVGFVLRVTSGHVVSLPRVPAGWRLTIANDDQHDWSGEVVGTAARRRAALAPPFFQRFAAIAATPEAARLSPTPSVELTLHGAEPNSPEQHYSADRLVFSAGAI